jgi:hypothetical protein
VEVPKDILETKWASLRQFIHLLYEADNAITTARSSSSSTPTAKTPQQNGYSYEELYSVS